MRDFMVVVTPYREKGGFHYMGNIQWAEGPFPMRHGKFPRDHPCAPGANPPSWPLVYANNQLGHSQGIEAFRARGYWASCFPEGDGITWQPTQGQTDAQCLQDIRECFGWDARWVTSPMSVNP